MTHTEEKVDTKRKAETVVTWPQAQRQQKLEKARNEFSLKPPEGARPKWHLDFSPVIMTSDLRLPKL